MPVVVEVVIGVCGDQPGNNYVLSLTTPHLEAVNMFYHWILYIALVQLG